MSTLVSPKGVSGKTHSVVADISDVLTSPSQSNTHTPTPDDVSFSKHQPQVQARQITLNNALSKFCVKCGWKHQANDRFCGGCGAKRN